MMKLLGLLYNKVEDASMTYMGADEDTVHKVTLRLTEKQAAELARIFQSGLNHNVNGQLGNYFIKGDTHE